MSQLMYEEYKEQLDAQQGSMATEYMTESKAKNNDKVDPNFDLIMNDDLAKNKWPKALTEHKKKEKQSLMAQTMTEELFNSLKDKKTKLGGWTIARAINTGTCHPSSFVGCHAGDLESYSLYKELFYPVIEKYHVGYKTDGSMKHVTDMDVNKIETELASNAQSKIISTRIRCARNLAMFPLNPANSKEQRLEVADYMEEVFKTLSGDLAGDFFRHSTMTPEQQQQLIDDHFLFRGKDKMQAASGYHQFWPEGRGIFVSKDKKFLLWINEGDHCRIISMEKGGDVKSVFSRLGRGVKAIEDGVRKIALEKKKIAEGDPVFASDPILGMVTCCPSNLGTGMRGSVHILVPKLIKSIGFDKIDEIARSMNCQARGSTGEHSEVIDRIDVSNWRRLGFRECDLVQDMIRCVNKLADMEDKCSDDYLTQSAADGCAQIDPYFDLIMNDDLAQNKWPKALTEHKKQEKQSLMAQTMTEELFNSLKDKKTKQGGWTIARAINTGTCHPSSFVGCHAGDLESYSLYKELFYPVIEKYHVGYKTDGSMKHVTDMDVNQIEIDLKSNAQSKIISTRIRCARNLAMFPLTPASTAECRLEVAAYMEEVFKTLGGDLAGDFFRHTTMTPEEQQQLIDDHFLFRGKDKMQAATGYHRFWPVGRGIFVSKDKKFLLWINEGDHCRIISMEKGGDVKSVFSRLGRGVKAIEDGVRKIAMEKKKIAEGDPVFASDPILGMVTCCPSNLGTGMRGSVHIMVPKLIKSIGFDEIDKIARSMNCQARGSTGEHSEVIDRIDVSNWRRLGFRECDLVQDMINCVNNLADMEDKAPE